MEKLEQRKAVILRAVILEYVAGAEPVASELLTVKYDLGVKSATIRNELAEMADLGFLEQPHTSSGRIPSDKGYRYYVDNLFFFSEPSSEAQGALSNSSQRGEALQLVLNQATRSLSRFAHLLSAATTIHGAQITVRTASVNAFGPLQALFVLGMSNGEVRTKIIECPPNLTLEDIGRVNESLLVGAVGKSVRSLQRGKSAGFNGTQASEKLLLSAWTATRAISREFSRGTLTTQGEEFLFGQPEFAKDAGRISDLIDEIKESDVLFESLTGPNELPSPVTIGREHKREQMHELSVVRQTFYVGQHEAGTIALVGPTRMNYDLSIPLVHFTARAISETMTRIDSGS